MDMSRDRTGSGSRLAATPDGGRTWQEQRILVDDFVYSIQFIDLRTGRIAGNGAVIGAGTSGA